MIDITSPLDLNHLDAEVFLRSLQGNILRGHGRSHVVLLFVQFKPDQPGAYTAVRRSSTGSVYASARAALARFADKYATSAWDQRETSRVYHDSQRRGLVPSEKAFGMIALTMKGYERLLTDEEDRPTDSSFRMGMRAAVAPGLAPPWEEPFPGDVHAMILLAHEQLNELKNLEGDIRVTETFFGIIHTEQGKKLLGQNGTPIEHFGYADGKSDPLLIEQDITQYRIRVDAPLEWNPAANLDLVLALEGQPREGEAKTYGSYMVFYKLEQNVALFRRLYDQDTGPRVFGRYPDGRPLISHVGEVDNNFNYAGDPDGRLCPMTAHIRKMNDRTRRHQIVRRGITYGDRQDLEGAGGDPPETGNGLLFMSFQVNIGQTFEDLQAQAADEGSPDALLDTAGSGGNLVTPKKGEYFFTPSLSFLRKLATLQPEQTAKFSKAWSSLLNNDDLLGKFGNKWKDSPLSAAELLGISPNDFATLYASYLKGAPTNMASIQAGRTIIDTGSNIIPQPLEPNQRERLNKALNQLLDPTKLGSFIAAWSTNPDQALNGVGLSRTDIRAFYKHLSGKDVNLDWPLWL
jgi:Dyp-type peroxidase family